MTGALVEVFWRVVPYVGFGAFCWYARRPRPLPKPELYDWAEERP